MRSITSKRQDSKVKAELLKEGALRYKLQHLDNDAIAAKLYAEGLGVEEDGVLKKPYSSAYIGKVVREALKEVAADRTGYAKEMQILIEGDLNSLIETWMPLALGEKEGEDGKFLPPSSKAAEIVRKCLADKSVLLGSNEAKKLEVEIQTNNALDGFISTLRVLLDEDTFSKILTAIDQATALNSEYYQSRQLEGNDDTIDAEIIS